MIRMSVQDAALATRATVIEGAGATLAGDVVIDSRDVVAGSVFVAFRGERVDGNAYVEKAVEAGASAVVVSADPAPSVLAAARDRGCAVLRAEGDDCEEFMLRLARAWRDRHPDWLVVGVTGSVGKTTTKDMLRAGIGAGARVHATAGNFNNLIGLPLTLFSAPEDAEVLVCELGMNHPHEIERLAHACRPTLAVITNVGTSHIGYLGSRENIARAKAEVVTGMEAHGEVGPCLYMTESGDFTRFIGEKFAQPAGVAVGLVGASDACCVRAAGVDLDAEGLPTFDVACADGWTRHVTLPVPGRQAVPDFLLAVAVVDRLGIDRDAAAAAIERAPMTAMRLTVVTTDSGLRVIDDSYNAAPNSMAAALDVLAEMRCEGSRIAVLGEMGELGDDARELHALVGCYAAAKGLDMLVFVGSQLAAHMAEAARTVGYSDDKIQIFATVEDATRTMRPILGPSDLVLAKASRSAGLDAFVKGVTSDVR